MLYLEETISTNNNFVLKYFFLHRNRFWFMIRQLIGLSRCKIQVTTKTLSHYGHVGFHVIFYDMIIVVVDDFVWCK